jgi:hypothetical protein
VALPLLWYVLFLDIYPYIHVWPISQSQRSQDDSRTRCCVESGGQLSHPINLNQPYCLNISPATQSPFTSCRAVHLTRANYINARTRIGTERIQISGVPVATISTPQVSATTNFCNSLNLILYLLICLDVDLNADVVGPAEDLPVQGVMGVVVKVEGKIYLVTKLSLRHLMS